ncbi:peptide deformylase [Anaplasma capra]|uniref:peptide deformylase n=1 Tax=Anaplasma capra TaxID=1562740 RepID=UPI0021D58D1F|nr:peptide deformylase [Anaplasma capra]MCU7611148.1 peptide deformylase [Anaplasma capra]MCU7612348.1 peptide deformylase [Anaplasma capra]
MPVLPLVTLPDSRLFLCSEEVDVAGFDAQLKTLADSMFETMYANKGIGLAAVQVGIHKRIFVVDLEYGTDRYEIPKDSGSGAYRTTCGPTVVINPVIVGASEELVEMEEGCLSVPDQREVVVRPERVIMEYVDLHGKKMLMKAEGLLARCLQHELDHLNGVVFLKHISKFKRDMVMEKIRKASRRVHTSRHNGHQKYDD